MSSIQLLLLTGCWRQSWPLWPGLAPRTAAPPWWHRRGPSSLAKLWFQNPGWEDVPLDPWSPQPSVGRLCSPAHDGGPHCYTVILSAQWSLWIKSARPPPIRKWHSHVKHHFGVVGATVNVSLFHLYRRGLHVSTRTFKELKLSNQRKKYFSCLLWGETGSLFMVASDSFTSSESGCFSGSPSSPVGTGTSTKLA